MLVMLVAALVGDLILLPALLVSPLGKFFKPRHGASGHLTDTAVVDSSIRREELSTWTTDVSETGVSDVAATGLSTGTGSMIATEDLPVLKVHTPPSRTGANQPKRK